MVCNVCMRLLGALVVVYGGRQSIIPRSFARMQPQVAARRSAAQLASVGARVSAASSSEKALDFTKVPSVVPALKGRMWPDGQVAQISSSARVLPGASIVEGRRNLLPRRRQPKQIGPTSQMSGTGSEGSEELKRFAALDILAASAQKRDVPPEDVFEAIRTLEQVKESVAVSGFEDLLSGDWRLIYTTGTKKSEDQIGRVNYVPITAIQRFDMKQKYIRNGVYLGPLSLEFEGMLRWLEDRRRLEFDFDDLKICGNSLPLPDWLRSQAGMKSSTPYKKQPAFNFVAVDGRVAAARGAGGGVALWLRNELVVE